MHPLHKLIGEIILATEIPDCQAILGKDCGGSQHIQLFCNGQAASATRFCSADAAVFKDDAVKVLIEIEESDIRPVALCGKVFASALVSHSNHRGKSYPVAPGVSFIQVIDTSKLSSRSSKLAQCLYLRESVRNRISISGGSLQHYEIFHGDIAEFERTEAQRELQDYLREAVSQ
jgi:hypothetical protein